MSSTNPTLLPCPPTPSCPTPQPRRAGQNYFRWLADDTGVMARLEIEFPEFATRWPTIHHQPDVIPPAKLGLFGFVCYSLTWEAPPNAHTRLLFVSPDGLHCALLDPIETLADLWRKLSRSPGPKQKPDAKPRSVEQRARRAKKKIA